MMDKRIPIILGVLIIAAFLVLAFGIVGPGIKFGGAKTYSELFDQMKTKSPPEYRCGGPVLVLDKALYSVGDEISVNDKIIAIEAGEYHTTFTFLYSGTQWRNESSGNCFSVQTNTDGFIDVRSSVFEIHITGDLHGLYDIGDSLSLKTTVYASGNDNVIGSIWVIVE